MIIFVTEVKTPRTLFRFRAVSQFYRFKQAPTAEADITQPGFSVSFRFQHHVCARSNFICAKANTCRQTRNGKTEPLESRRQQRVLFEAISAAPIAHEFGLQTSQIEQNRFAEEDVEIFEWNMRRARDERHAKFLHWHRVPA